MDKKQLQRRKEAADKNWERIKNRVLSGEKVDQAIIVDAMEACNTIDQEIENLKMKDYLKDRKEYLVDCDHTCSDPKIDAWHDELRKQYQEVYGKDVKHG